MLHINKIIIKNFRPYYGTQSFDFGKNDGLSIVLGDNGIGKSSLIRAIKFVLYDELDSIGAFKIKNELNIVAWEEENFEMYVALDFEYNNDSYVLKRIKRIKGSVHGLPRSDNDFEDTVTLIKNQNFLSVNETMMVLKNIIPKKISEYILFEGETISKYKDLLDNNKNLEIYDSIRKILGITTLENSKSDLEKHLEKLHLERLKLVREQSKNQKLLDELNRLTEQQNQFIESKKQIEIDLITTIDSKNKNETTLKNNQRIRELIEKKSELNVAISTINESIKIKKEALKTYLKNYKSICYDLINSEITKTPQDINQTMESLNNNHTIVNEIDILRNLILKSKCSYCGHDIASNEVNTINNRIVELEKDIVTITDAEKNKLDKYNLKISTLKTFSNQIQPLDFSKLISNIESDIQIKLIEKDNTIRKLSDIESQIEGLGGSSNIEQVAKAYSIASKNEEIYKGMLKNAEDEIKRIQTLIDDIIKKSPSTVDLTSIDSKIQKTTNLIEVLKLSIEKYSENMRTKVQHDASLMFKSISENQQYDRLVFDENYGLKLIDVQNRVVPNISSGYMTLITISLIYGLHKNSSLTGTIILDAPFSVLTNFHRDKIIKTFQTLSPQVLLLVYKDQIDIESIRAEMQGKLLNEYEIYQDRNEVNSSYKTNIREVK
jgi:exonuclease SbcC